MRDEELEAIRPPNVTMGAMKAWLAARRLIRACATVFVLMLVVSFGLKSPWVALAMPGAALALAVAFWIGVLMFGFARYSLQTLLVSVLITAGLLTGYFTADDDEQRLRFVTYLVLWAAVAALFVLDLDPVHQAKWKARVKKTAPEKEAGDPEPRA